MLEQVKDIVEGETYAQHLGIELIEAQTDRVVLLLPYAQHLGVGRIHGGAISSLVDLAATCAVWSHKSAGPQSRGATVGFTINFLRLAVACDLTATAELRRRGGTLCVCEVSVKDPEGEEIAMAAVTYKLNATPPS